MYAAPLLLSSSHLEISDGNFKYGSKGPSASVRFIWYMWISGFPCPNLWKEAGNFNQPTAGI